jgi:hypothetical protein
MANTKVMTGARAVLKIDSVVIGIFNSCNFSSSVGLEPIHVLGRYTPAEITPVSYEMVRVNVSGFRIFKQGVTVLGKYPTVNQLLDLPTFTLEILDRGENKTILKVRDCICESYSSGFEAKGVSRIQLSIIGTRFAEEDKDGADPDTTINESTPVQLP